MKFTVFIILILLFISGCHREESLENKAPAESNFCRLMSSPASYDSQELEITAVVLGYHSPIVYHPDCDERGKIAALELTYQQRGQIMEKLQSRPKYVYDVKYLNDNIYAEVTMKGVLRKNEKSDPTRDLTFLDYRFFAGEILEAKALTEEIVPHK